MVLADKLILGSGYLWVFVGFFGNLIFLKCGSEMGADECVEK